MPLYHPCLDCGDPIPASEPRCDGCQSELDAAYEATRLSRQERGYDVDHDRARRALALTLPAACGYCGKPVLPFTRWVAAHRVDGDPSAGWMVSHPDCNERAKARLQEPARFVGRPSS
jgi:hypothetical protein